MSTNKSYTCLQFEFDESEDRDTQNDVVESSAVHRKPMAPNPPQKAVAPAKMAGNRVTVAKSLPVNIQNCRKIFSDNAAEAAEEDGGGLPPHEYLARRRGASMSVHEGVGRTLKGRDLWSVRNAIWKQIGFED